MSIVSLKTLWIQCSQAALQTFYQFTQKPLHPEWSHLDLTTNPPHWAIYGTTFILWTVQFYKVGLKSHLCVLLLLLLFIVSRRLLCDYWSNYEEQLWVLWIAILTQVVAKLMIRITGNSMQRFCSQALTYYEFIFNFLKSHICCDDY